MKRGIVVGGDVGVARATARTALGPRLSVKTALNDSIRMAFVYAESIKKLSKRRSINNFLVHTAPGGRSDESDLRSKRRHPVR